MFERFIYYGVKFLSEMDSLTSPLASRLGILTVHQASRSITHESLRDSGVDELLDLCGGCCHRVTRYVYIEEQFVMKIIGYEIASMINMK